MQPLDPLTLPCDGVRLIEASAGTGKTYTIATLYLRLLLERRLSVREILVVTFTVAATEELRERVRARLREAVAVLEGVGTGDAVLAALIQAQSEPAQAAQRLRDELTLMDEAAIFTIHGFCQRVLAEHAFESGGLFDAEFIVDDGELRRAAVEEFWRRRLYRGSAGLVRLAAEEWGTPAGLMAQLKPLLAGVPPRIVPAVKPGLADESVYRQVLAEIRALWHAESDRIMALLRDSTDLSRNAENYCADNLDFAAAALADYLAGESEDYRVPDKFELFTQSRIHDAVTPAKRKKGIVGPEHRFFALAERLVSVRRRCVVQLFAEAAGACREDMQHRKADGGLLSFDDLLSQLVKALHDAGGERLAERVVRRFPVALIDEFQDTDPEQYRIFRRLYHGRTGTALFMIGDPKQAIYSFRGADVFTYIGAKRDTDCDGDRFTLDTNWRSCRALVAAVNGLFAPHPAPFVYAGDIDFVSVQAAGRADQEPLVVHGCESAPMRVWWVPASDENTDKTGRITIKWARPAIAAAVASEIAHLIACGAQGEARIGAQALAPRDIAVLVRTHDEGAAVQRALRAAGIASVSYGQDSVFASAEATELLDLLMAVAEPGDERRLRVALASGLVGYGAAELDALGRDELRVEALAEQMHSFARLWSERGFMPMFRQALKTFGTAHRLLALPDGERRMTNVLQLSELIQSAAQEHTGIDNLLRWYAGACSAPEKNDEAQQLRLESDEALVKIVTLHKSKGLEYPVVFLPFPWSARRVNPKGPVLCHDEDGAAVFDLGSDEFDANYRRAERERLAEDLRLLYVALTRAKHRCYVTWGRFAGAENSALAWLLHGERNDDPENLAALARSCDDEATRGAVTRWAGRVPDALSIESLPGAHGVALSVGSEAPLHLVAHTPQRAVPWNWRMTSYTALTAGQGHARDYGSEAEDRTEPWAPGTAHILQFPRGARAGTFMHKLFERCDFPKARGEALRVEVQQQLQRHGYGAQWQTAVETMVAQTLDTALDGDGLLLRDVTASHRLVELEFCYPLAALSAETVNRMMRGLGDYSVNGPALHFQATAGAMRGFIDLIVERDGRFFIVDYKSNYLGGEPDDYTRPRLAAAVAENRYDFQYLIYTVALHRYLQRRVRGYDYERHFGGVYYLFLRGMDARRGPETGVHFDRPAAALIFALDALFREGAA